MADGADIPLKDYLEQQIEDVRSAAALALEAARTEPSVPLRDYIERIFTEQEEATQVAEREREKAALIAREGLEHQFKAGDVALERHMAEQVQQLRQLIVSQRELIDNSFQASEKAIAKAEVATDKRFESSNAFREQLTTQSATFVTRDSHETTVKQLTALLERNREDVQEQRGAWLPVGTFESTVHEWTGWRSTVDQRLTEGSSNFLSRKAVDDLIGPVNEKISALQSWQSKMFGAFGLAMIFMPVIVGIIVYLLTRTAIPVDGLNP